jgi:malate dehydrogenase (oxaloacetate-decarboxylating)
MLMAAAQRVADLVDAHLSGASLLPQVENLREVSAAVAVEVARTAQSEGLARVELNDILQQIQDSMWLPSYRQFLIEGRETP